MKGFNFRFCIRRAEGASRLDLVIGSRLDGAMPGTDLQADCITLHHIFDDVIPCRVHPADDCPYCDPHLVDINNKIALSIVDKIGFGTGCFEVSLNGGFEEFSIKRIARHSK